MPSVHRSFYANEVYGMPFWDFLSTELPGMLDFLLTDRVAARGRTA